MGARKKPIVIENLDNEDDDGYSDVDLDSATPASADNARDIPMFADTDGRSLRSIAVLKLYKLDQPNPGYKGVLPLHGTLDTIGELYGDGLYQIEACNARHKVISVKENIRIALRTGATTAALAASSESDRIERLAMASAEESKIQAQSFIQLVMTMTTAAAERERASMREMARSQGEFYATMMAMAQRSFENMMSLTAANNAHVMATVSAGTQSTTPKHDPTEILLRGLQMGREIANPEVAEGPLWRSMLQDGLSVLAGVAAPKPSLQLQPTTQPKPAHPFDAIPPGERKMLADAMKLYNTVRARGIDPADIGALLSNAGEKPQVPEPESPDSDPSDDESEEDEPEDLDAEDDDDDGPELGGVESEGRQSRESARAG